jgi:prephenate dehydrogenase
MFRNVVIIGVGLIGGSLAAAFKRFRIARKITGVSSADTIARGLTLRLLDAGFTYDELPRACANADLVILATPIDRILELLPQVLQAVPRNAIVTDVGSTKREIMRQAGRIGRNGAAFIGGHPMAGSEKKGIAASDPFLFQNAIYVLTPAPRTPKTQTEKLRRSMRAIGARVIVLDPAAHDRIAATISHLPQMLAVALINTTAEISHGDEHYLKLAAGGFRDMTRIASSPYNMWRDICRTNHDLIVQRIDQLVGHLKKMRKSVGRESLGREFTQAGVVRGRIPRDTKGFLYAHPEVLVVTEDKPGMLAKITTALGRRHINISDIEVLKVREGDGGTIRLSLKDTRAARQAVQVLNRAGFVARIRE